MKTQFLRAGICVSIIVLAHYGIFDPQLVKLLMILNKRPGTPKRRQIGKFHRLVRFARGVFSLVWWQ